jgi:hypothetical protein
VAGVRAAVSGRLGQRGDAAVGVVWPPARGAKHACGEDGSGEDGSGGGEAKCVHGGQYTRARFPGGPPAGSAPARPQSAPALATASTLRRAGLDQNATAPTPAVGASTKPSWGTRR